RSGRQTSPKWGIQAVSGQNASLQALVGRLACGKAVAWVVGVGLVLQARDSQLQRWWNWGCFRVPRKLGLPGHNSHTR
ncbi:MAG: hypothetical protein MK364_16610, partial [Pirellulales bacterium]|nr:hypothetical protein [Pirellulales bacterium]